MKKEYSKKRKQHQDLRKLFVELAARLEDYESPPKDIGYWYGESELLPVSKTPS